MKHYLILLRPSNFLITMASVFVSALLAGAGAADILPMALASIAAGLIGGGGMVINDLFDVEIDRINKPSRPLPSGAVSPRSAASFYAGVTSLGLLLNLFLHSGAQVIAAGAALLIFFYSYRLKRTPLLGNLTVGALTGLAFLYGGTVVGRIDRAIMPAIFAFLINVGREIVKDMEDLDGDARQGAKTFPVVFGMKKSAMLASAFLFAVICSTIVPFLTHQYGFAYLTIVAVGVDLVLAGVIASLWREMTPGNLGLLSAVLKYDMIIGLAAIYAG